MGEQPTTLQTSAGPDELLRLRPAVEASGEIVFMTDARGVITSVNPEFVRLDSGRLVPRDAAD